jgi:dihydroorotate dehydrogenase (NAD+) catalytic subunit
MPGIAIDPDSGHPILKNKIGGLSGPAVKPIALRCVWEISQTVKIPVIGVGGIMNGKDTLEMIMAGASAVEIGTAVYYRGVHVFKDICKELEALMDKHGFRTIKDFQGKAHLSET